TDLSHDRLVHRAAGREYRHQVHSGTSLPMTEVMGTGPKYRLSKDAGTPSMSRKTSPGTRDRQPFHAGSGRPSRSISSVSAATCSLMTTMPESAQTRSSATAAMRFTTGTDIGR